MLDNELRFAEDQSEWPGTTIAFELSPHGCGTDVRFSHRGLVPAFECCEVCSNAWSFYIHSSLKDLIATGRGEPIERVQRHPAGRIGGAVALVTGANREIGRTLTEALLERGAARVYATARDPEALADLPQRDGAIVNVGSAAGLANVPMLPTYSASKAALHSFTQAADPTGSSGCCAVATAANAAWAEILEQYFSE